MESWPKLVTSFEQVEENARRFSKVTDTPGTFVYKHLNGFYHWYYFKDLGVFAPSKLVGALGSTLENYAGALSGGDTERRLQQWFKAIDPEVSPRASARWLRILERYVQNLGKSLNRSMYGGRGRIHVSTEEYDELCQERKPNVWMVRSNGGEWTRDFIEGEYVGFDQNLNDVDVSQHMEQVREEVGRARPDLERHGVINVARGISDFFENVEIGDYVVTDDGQQAIHYGILGASDYVIDNRPCSNRRHAYWKGRFSKQVFSGLHLRQNAIFQLNDLQSQAVFRAIRRVDLLPDAANAHASTKSDVSSIMQSLADELLLDLNFLEEVRVLLEDKRQVIFQGPPGTGKTYVAQKLAGCLAGSPDHVTIVQFHPSYAYEDFVQGFRPTLDQNRAGFKLNKGPLLEVAEQARDNREQKYFLIIDEINRGNLAKVFGELYFLLEYRGEQVRLQYEPKSFHLPDNLYIVGTMNTADRSKKLLNASGSIA